MNNFLIVLVFITLLPTYSDAYDNVTTHRKITEDAVTWSQLDTIAKNNLGFSSGYMEVISGQQIIKWLSDGSYLEDVPKCRASNHFHNPLLSWDQSYMTDMYGLPSVYCSDWIPRYSAITWATGYLAPPPDGAKASFSSSLTYGPNNWDKAREYYYKSLTLSNKVDRDIFFTWSFTAIGQVMHLLQDMAVPAHTRNDFSSHLMNGYKQPFEYYVQAHPDLITGSIPVTPSFDNAKLTDYWDTNKYNGSNPSTFTGIGLAEFSNANYFSDYTIPNNGTTSEHTFPYPYLSSSNMSGASYQICPQQIAQGIMQKYVSRKKNGQPCPSPTDANAIDHFAATGLFFGYPDHNSVSYVWLDDNVHNTYAKELLPRAVGYSAGLLNYFFRGQLGVKRIPVGIKVKNANTESMTSYTDHATGNTIGTISVYYDDASNVRHPLATYNLSTPLAPGEEVALSFTAPANNILVDRYIVVFQGKLGNEEGAVIGKIYAQPIYYVKRINGLDQIYRVGTDGSNDTVVYENNIGDSIGKIAVSPDGNTLAFAGGPQIKLLVITSVPTTTVTDLTTGNWPDWSPDGTKIAFARDLGLMEIFFIDVATRQETQLTTISDGHSSSQPVWSPDGNTIAYTRDNTATTDCYTYSVVYLMDASGKPLGPLTCPPTDVYITESGTHPAWSPDGDEIAYMRLKWRDVVIKPGDPVRRSAYQLYTVNVSTKAITKLTDSTDIGYDEMYPAWSPDGTTIAVCSSRDGDLDNWLVDSQGNGYLVNLTNANSDVDKYPAFGK